MAKKLDELAKTHGIELTRPAIATPASPVSDETKRKLLIAIHANPFERSKCYLPRHLDGERVWGISLQLYELRSSRNWGIGDFEDLKAFCELGGRLGADFVGLNPLHAPFMSAPERCSPYEPSNRQFLNPLYIAVDRVPGFSASRALDRSLAQLRRTELVNYVGVAKAKLPALRRIWRGRKTWPGVENRKLAEFQDRGGTSLWGHATFEAISELMTTRGHGAGWTDWPLEFHDPDGESVARFQRSHEGQIEFHVWLQYLAHSQLMEAADAAERAGLRIGLYLDLAVGEALDGSGTWGDRDAYVWGASIGSPPDPWAVDGQDWRLAALQPATIAAGRGAPFRKLLEAAMRYAGAIRIDHAAALRRLFLVPFDSAPTEGAYVAYPQDQLLSVLGELSSHHQCLVIGEDLGLIPEGLRDALRDENILSYRILSYEKTNKGFIAPARYPALALACVSTHDHQTISEWWRGQDVEMRLRHGLIRREDFEEQIIEREQDQVALCRAFKRAAIRLETNGNAGDIFTEALTTAAYRYLAKSPAKLIAARLSEMVDERRPTNVPGTSDTYPNWRPRLFIPLERLAETRLFQSVIAALNAERPRGTDVQTSD